MGSNLGSDAGRSNGEARAALVDRAAKGWIRKLVDVTRRNNLLYFRELKTGTFDLTGSDSAALDRLLSGEAVAIEHLVPGIDRVRANACLLEIKRRALTNSEEKGLETLFLALGFATWPSDDGGRPADA